MELMLNPCLQDDSDDDFKRGPAKKSKTAVASARKPAVVAVQKPAAPARPALKAAGSAKTPTAAAAKGAVAMRRTGKVSSVNRTSCERWESIACGSGCVRICKFSPLVELHI